jgi:hypothetical protein
MGSQSLSAVADAARAVIEGVAPVTVIVTALDVLEPYVESPP